MRKAKVLAIGNQKGGTGKSTIASSLMAGLALRGFKVLGLDLDPQANLSFSAGIVGDGLLSGLGILEAKAQAVELVRHTPQGDLIPAAEGLAGADVMLTRTGKEFILKEKLEPLLASYDFIILDTPPALGIITVNALTAAEACLVPAQADLFSLQGLARLGETIEAVRKYCNRELRLAGVVLSRHTPRSIVSRDMSQALSEEAQRQGARLFKSSIREAVAVKEAQLSQLSIFEYAPKSNVAADFEALITELLQVLQEIERKP